MITFSLFQKIRNLETNQKSGIFLQKRPLKQENLTGFTANLFLATSTLTGNIKKIRKGKSLKGTHTEKIYSLHLPAKTRRATAACNHPRAHFERLGENY